MPYDKDYVDPIIYTAEVSMEFDPEDLKKGELPNFAPIASQEKELLIAEAKEKNKAAAAKKIAVLEGGIGVKEQQVGTSGGGGGTGTGTGTGTGDSTGTGTGGGEGQGEGQDELKSFQERFT